MSLNSLGKKLNKAVLALTVVMILIAAALAWLIAEIALKQNVRFVPDYEKTNITAFEGRSHYDFSPDDYRLLFWQTGLGRDAVDSVFGMSEDPIGVLKLHQYNFFNPPAYMRKRIFLITGEERLHDGAGNYAVGFLFADVRDGDVFITGSTHTLGWRHGHAGIVINAENGHIAEAVFKGSPSAIQHIHHWRTYATFMQLRPVNREAGEAAAAFTAENLIGVNYSIFAGFFADFGAPMRTTQCAHLPWYAYLRFGYDINPGGRWPVTPRNITRSAYFEIVQIFGFHPHALWN